MNLQDVNSVYSALRWGGPFLALLFFAVGAYVFALLLEYRPLLYVGLGFGVVHLSAVAYLLFVDSDRTSWFYLFSGALLHGIFILIVGFLLKEGGLKKLGWAGIALGLVAGLFLEVV